jgi:type I restriction enzyme S subunit
VPPVESQKRVVEMLKHESLARKEAERWNQYLNEFRTRLISDVVTGKLDVREAAATLPETDPLVADDEPDTLDAESETGLEDLDVVAEEAL